MHEDNQTVALRTPNEVIQIALAVYDWREDFTRVVSIPAEPGTTYFIGEDGLAYDYTENGAVETIQNYSTQENCHSLIIVAEHDTPTERDLKAYSAAVHERELHEDLFGN